MSVTSQEFFFQPLTAVHLTLYPSPWRVAVVFAKERVTLGFYCASAIPYRSPPVAELIRDTKTNCNILLTFNLASTNN